MVHTISDLKYIPNLEPCGAEKITFSYIADGIKKVGSFDADHLMSSRNNMFLKDNVIHGISNEDFFALIRCIRHGRDLFKYTKRGKSYEEWRNSCMPLEDYLPIGSAVDQEWVQCFQRLEGTAKYIYQWTMPYSPQIDRPKLEECAYHTFSLYNKTWQYRGVCCFNSTQNQVSNIEFAGKLEYPGPGPMAGESVYYRSEREFAWRLEEAQTMGRPVNPVFMIPEDYQIDVAYGYGREAGVGTTGPLTDQELEEESRLVVYRLCSMTEKSFSRIKGYYQIPLSHHIDNRATADDIKNIIGRLPIDGVTHQRFKSDSTLQERYYLYVSHGGNKPNPGCGLSGAQKRFRDENGVLVMRSSEVEKLTREEANLYFRHGEEYIHNGRLYTYYRYKARTCHGTMREEGRFVSGDSQIFVYPPNLGTFLPDVSSVGSEFVAVRDSRFQPLVSLTKELREYVMNQIQSGDTEPQKRYLYLEWPKGAGKSVPGSKPQEPAQP